MTLQPAGGRRRRKEGRSWYDGEAGRLVRPYTVSGGRTTPRTAFGLLSQVRATGTPAPAHLGPEHSEVLGLCSVPASVAELAGRLRLPVVVTKVLLSDLVDCGSLVSKQPDISPHLTDRSLLEALLDGLRRRL
ncbi:DUF742 domain-containing protein [Streptomyces sp. SPB074]|uniref:DUF742 domain-containing protein n=1 Tax=Streptomyces sp. (strain SPB074) TaxID=465543 RepID=UPI00017F1633|nr:DUF742 domain-containing protein [Streptomyces sp. SPB074]EDY45494.1 conserved hypothetical protein [Streptomyces sp. SPB074]